MDYYIICLIILVRYINTKITVQVISFKSRTWFKLNNSYEHRGKFSKY